MAMAVVADTAPKEIAGLSGGVFNTFGSLAAITTPIVIGYLVKTQGSFDLARDVRGRALECGHTLQEERPDEVLTELDAFLGPA